MMLFFLFQLPGLHHRMYCQVRIYHQMHQTNKCFLDYCWNADLPMPSNLKLQLSTLRIQHKNREYYFFRSMPPWTSLEPLIGLKFNSGKDLIDAASTCGNSVIIEHWNSRRGQLDAKPSRRSFRKINPSLEKIFASCALLMSVTIRWSGYCAGNSVLARLCGGLQVGACTNK